MKTSLDERDIARINKSIKKERSSGSEKFEILYGGASELIEDIGSLTIEEETIKFDGFQKDVKYIVGILVEGKRTISFA